MSILCNMFNHINAIWVDTDTVSHDNDGNNFIDQYSKCDRCGEIIYRTKKYD